MWPAMVLFEWIVAVLSGAVVLAAIARRVGAPHPAFLALGGASLAFIPGVPELRLDPELALVLFLAPVLLDAGYDASLRDRRVSWQPVLGLAVGAVVVTTLAVAVVARDAVLAMRRRGDIGDDAFFLLEEEFDWAELSATPRAET
jgi:CPA1 family monovalent cation:H+ antiporter